MNSKLIKLVHKLVVKLSTKHLAKMYNLLNVKLLPTDLDPESWYGGVPHPVTGEVLLNGKCIETMMRSLFLSIKDSVPLCKEKHGNSFIIWSQGDNQPTYTHCKNGIGFLSNKEYDCYHLDKNEKLHHCGKSKGKLLSDGKYGLGVPYYIACVLWDKKTIDNLSLKSEDIK